MKYDIYLDVIGKFFSYFICKMVCDLKITQEVKTLNIVHAQLSNIQVNIETTTCCILELQYRKEMPSRYLLATQFGSIANIFDVCMTVHH